MGLSARGVRRLTYEIFLCRGSVLLVIDPDWSNTHAHRVSRKNSQKIIQKMGSEVEVLLRAFSLCGPK